MTTQAQLHATARQLARLLKEKQRKIVFAESCTGGLISAALTRIPGISAYHCGSAVVYQVETKEAWLGISAKLLKSHGPVSREVAKEMAERVLSNTPHADLAASVTGFLGPDSPPGKDGLIFCAVAQRKSHKLQAEFQTVVKRHQFEAVEKMTTKAALARLRFQRQVAATHFVLTEVIKFLAKHS